MTRSVEVLASDDLFGGQPEKRGSLKLSHQQQRDLIELVCTVRSFLRTVRPASPHAVERMGALTAALSPVRHCLPEEPADG